MIAYLLELFLAQFYLLEAICGDFMTDKAKEKMFDELAKVFCVSQVPALKKYYQESNGAQFKDIRDYADYERFCRTIEFAEKSGQEIDFSEDDRMILAQKRAAMSIKATLFQQGKNLTQETIATTLLHMAMQGNVDAMATLAYFEYHGLCLCKDRKNAMKRIRLCANWNSLFGNLMGIAYDGENANTYYDTLYTIFQNVSQKRVFQHICQFTGHGKEEANKNPVAKILEKGFGLHIIKRNSYDQGFAKVAFSELTSVEDKEKILLSRQKDAIVALSDIPFDANYKKQVFFDDVCLEKAPLKRQEEARKIKQNLKVALDCPSTAYTPIMIASTEAYVTDMYQELLQQGFSKAPVVEIDAGMLTEQDFSAGKENVFLRGLSETKSARTVFFLKHCERIEREPLRELVKMLDYTYRRKFKLFQPTVSLDLSHLLFVLFAAEKNPAVMELDACCDTVWARPIQAEEKNAVIDAVFTARTKAFGCKYMQMEWTSRILSARPYRAAPR